MQCILFVIIYKRKLNTSIQGHPCEAIGWHEFMDLMGEVELFGRTDDLMEAHSSSTTELFIQICDRVSSFICNHPSFLKIEFL
jgi:hypothetical protein